jgi:LPS-assembly protein
MRLRPTPLALALAVALPVAFADARAQTPAPAPEAAIGEAGSAPPVLKLAPALEPPPLRSAAPKAGPSPDAPAGTAPTVAPPASGPAPTPGTSGKPLEGSPLRVAPFAAGDGPIFMRADRLDGVVGKYVEAEGKVELRTRSETVLADWLHYDFNLDEIWGKGGVLLRRGPDSISGPEAKFKRDTETGYFREPRFVIGSNGARGSASTLEFNGPDRFDVTDGRYSTCVAPREDWYVRMDELEIDQKRRVGTGRNATVRFFDVPIAYTPWFEFPLDNERKTGFLVPTLGATGIRGFEAAVPYYLNLAPNYDATITPRLMTKRGLQLGGQGRYLFETFAGELNAEFLPHDRQTGTDRWGVSFRHNQDLSAITPGLAGYLNLNKVSDDTYFADLSDRIAVTSQSSLPREGGFTWARGPWQALLRAQSFQTLQDPGSPPVTPPYNRMPQLAGRLLETDWLGLSFDGAAEYVDFRQPALEPTGGRMYIYPGVSWDRQGAAWFVTARAAVHARQYWLDGAGQTDSTPSVTVPIASVDGGLVFERDWKAFGNDFVQTLEPRAFYVYIPYRNQNTLPNFDSAEDDFNFAQLFSVNRYLGNDRIGDANQLTLALTSRLLESATGAERLRVAVGQRFYFEDQKVTLGSEAPQAAGTSDLLALAEGRITDAWAVAGLWQYNFDSSQTERFNLGLRWTPGPGRVVNGSYRYSRTNEDPQPGSASELKQFDVSGQWPVAPRWTLLGRWNYSLADRKTLEAVVGVEYNADCWSLRVAAQRLTTTSETTTTSVYAQIELNGLARFGTSPLDLMRRSVPGYQQSNDPTISPREQGEPFPDY